MSNDNQSNEVPLEALFHAVSRQRDRLAHELALAEATNMVLGERNRELQKAVDAFIAKTKPVGSEQPAARPSEVARKAAAASIAEQSRPRVVGAAPQVNQAVDEVDEDGPIADVAFING